MPQITLQKAQQAISTAWQRYKKGWSGQFSITISSDMVNIIFERKDNKLNYGFPNIYKLPNEHIGALQVWWELFSGGRLLPPQQKSIGVWAVNAVYDEEVLKFNFHVPIAHAPSEQTQQGPAPDRHSASLWH